MQRPFYLILLFLLFSADLRAETNRPADFATLKQLLQSAEDKQLYKHPRWIRLGHYQKNFWGQYISEADGEQFFLSPTGKHSPREELMATIRSFLDPVANEGDRNHPQCRFLARRTWLFKELQLDGKIKKLSCNFQIEWKAKLNPEKVSLIFASAYMNNPSSMFGHTFLKFHTRGNEAERDLLNYGVNYAASTGTDGGIPFAILGLIGGYKGYFSLQIYYLKLLDYSNIEGRDIWEYELNLTPEEIEFLVDHLLELEKTNFDYYFLSENCSYHLLTALEAVRLDLDLTSQLFYHAIPADTVRLITDVPGLVNKKTSRPSLRTEFRTRYKKLDRHGQKLIKKFITHPDVANFKQSISAEEKNLKVDVWDTINSWLAIKDYSNHSQWQETTHRGKVARAEITLPSPPINILPEVAAPEEGHPPAKLALGFGHSDLTDQNFLDLNFRAAFHSLTDPPKGFLQFSQIEIFHWRFRYFEDSHELRFTEFQPVNIISAAPIDGIFYPISWRFSFGYEHLHNRDIFVRGGPGLTYSPIDNLALMGFVDVDFSYADDRGDEGVRSYIGPAVSLLWNMQKKYFHTGLIVNGSWQRNTSLGLERRKISSTLSASLNSDWQTQLNISLLDEGSLSNTEKLAQLGLMFLW